jgi:hypothetical protein
VPGEEEGPGSGVRQDTDAARDALPAGGDLTVSYYQAGSGSQVRAPGSGPVVVGDVPQLPPGFVPRAGLLSTLDAAGPGAAVVHAVTGTPGVGKTQLAAAYAHAKLAAGWDLVAWVNAENRASLAGGLATVAEAIRPAGPGGGDPGQAVRHWLEASGDQCLLVFDNATDPDLLRPYLPVAGAARVLVATDRESAAQLGAGVRVEVFTPGEAAEFLAGRTGLADPTGAGELAEELGYLPLALAHAAAVIRAQHLAYGMYLERLRALPVGEHLTRGPGQPYPPGVAEAVLLSLEAVRAADRSGVCAGVLEVLSVLSAAGVRRDLLHAAGQAGALTDAADRLDAAAVDEALGRLAEWSLLAFSLDGQAATAHRLVLRVIRERLARQGRLTAVCRAAAAVLDTHARTVADSPDRLAVRDIPEQVAALWKAAAAAAGGPGELVAILLRLRLWALYHLGELGDSAAQAIEVGEPLLEDAEQVLGPDHRGTLAARNNLANAYRAAGRAAEAIPLHEQTLAAFERVLGADHPDTLRSRGSLALAYQDAGRAAEAIPLHEQTLAARERVLGADHPDTLAARNDLAAAYQAAGRTAKAIPLLEQTVPAFERVLGPDHPDTLAARNNLARAYQDTGWAAAAIPLHQQTLAGQERVLGADHLDTLAARNNLAAAYQAAGRPAEAIPLFEQTVPAFERVLGPDHPDTLAARNNLAAARQAAGRPAEAIPLHQQTLATFARVLGPDHPRTLAARNNLAAAERAAGRAAEAIPLYQQTLTDREHLLGPDDPETLAARDNLAAACLAAGRYTEAIPLYQQTLTDREHLLGPDDPETLAARNSLAAACRAADPAG